MSMGFNDLDSTWKEKQLINSFAPILKIDLHSKKKSYY